jgi:hypothetical protein
MPSKSLETLQDMVGWESPAFPVPIERGRVEDFAKALHDDDPVFTVPVEAQARGLSDCPVPVTFFGSLFYLNQEIHEPDLGFDTANKLHGEQRFEFEQTPTVGETLSGKTTLVDVSQRDRGSGTLTKAELRMTYRDQDGELIATGRKVLLEVTDG